MKDPYVFEPHGPWIFYKAIGKQVCRKCGLVDLNNDFTRWSIRKGCNNEDHPEYANKRKLAKSL